MTSFCVKLKSKNGQVIVKDLKDSMSLAELKGRIAELTHIKEEQLHILIGFPPRPLDLSDETEKSISSAGIKSGETLIVEEKSGASRNAKADAKSSSTTPNASPKKETSTSNSQLEADEALARRLQAEEQAEAEAEAEALRAQANVIVSKKIDTNTNANTTATTNSHPNETVNSPTTSQQSSPIHTSRSESTTPSPTKGNNGDFNGILLKKVVPADNSCLFTSIRFVLNSKVDNEGSEMMRHIIAQEVATHPHEYNDAVLGKSNAEYCKWIQKPESWGGAIEIAILSNYYGIEIDVVDIQNAIINRFGEDRNYGLRVFLLFDGIHYDPLYMETQGDTAPATIFPVEEISVYQQAEQLANEAKSARQFTNVDKFSLRCLQCDTLLVGQVQAQKHAKSTGHTNFREI